MDDYQFDILNNLTKAPGNMGTDFHDGFMLANDYEFIIYGGYLRLRDESASINEMWSLARYMIQNGATPLSDPGEFQLLALDNITRYIASAGSVNVPSENKAYVFSGATVSSMSSKAICVGVRFLRKCLVEYRERIGVHSLTHSQRTAPTYAHMEIAPSSYPLI
jgi:hypothetical protein